MCTIYAIGEEVCTNYDIREEACKIYTIGRERCLQSMLCEETYIFYAKGEEMHKLCYKLREV